ncbi:hypothetical protein T4B_4419 [Trichinella pseudospiralis]|uniref:Uncharacterized protein n=1 Tax=Trichinella pseudospiralis TaxID=6337 RepID=A0A0V1GQQ2_TRIPS|nr:hypothetical protein T4B_4419 [Trichinella pseudospiralis]KRZ38022.1 hypothetical protein T4C_8032 [Trichinella pseudospiralis]
MDTYRPPLTIPDHLRRRFGMAYRGTEGVKRGVLVSHKSDMVPTRGTPKAYLDRQEQESCSFCGRAVLRKLSDGRPG